ncbi:MAG: DNA mismatch repair protein MutS [Thermoplasmata archaeon]
MADGTPTTPLMEQYGAVKAQYPGHVILFRVGDFYEGFGEDARLLSRELEVVLTARSPDTRGDRTPMAGVPHHALETYLGRLVRKGYKVAICDQVEEARFAKGLVRREVTRVVTPGTVIEERILGGPEHNFLAAVAGGSAGAAHGFAAVDVTTGELFSGVGEAPGLPALLGSLAPFGPREILLPTDGSGELRSDLVQGLGAEFPAGHLEPAPTPRPPTEWPERLRSAAPGPAVGAETEAIGMLVGYLERTQPRLLPFLERCRTAPGDHRLRLDGKTLRHLEITRPMNPEGRATDTLLSAWDETVTGPGRRTLAFWMKTPLADRAAITARQDAVQGFVALGAGLEELRARLAEIADLSRIATRLAGRRVRPPELDALRRSLTALLAVKGVLVGASDSALRELADRLDDPGPLRDRLTAALPDDLPPTVEAGGLFRPGFATEIDLLRRVKEETLAALELLERREGAETGIKSLKIGYTQVFGYYFEVTRPHLARVPERFRRKQTLAGAERFTTPELEELEGRILSARERSQQAEGDAWEHLLDELDRSVPHLHRLARAVGAIDVLLSFARIAVARGYVRPILDDSLRITFRDGRHPVLDRTLAERFVPNDTDLDGEGTRLLVLTGPNMSGKSTYMRQVGLLVVLGQVGAFLPARYARIGLVGALYTRMGFTDEIARGKSSFMVEMSEVSDILRGADRRSLVLLDEVGRGTSTFDGLALAWAIVKQFHDGIGCRTILATHYHQLAELLRSLPGAANAHLAVREEGDRVVFLHRVVPGSTDRSYGLNVARLAGLPPELLREAESLLARLERTGLKLGEGSARDRTGPVRYTQAILLTEEDGAAGPSRELARALRELRPEEMTPVQALAWLATWKDRLASEPPPETGR